MLSTFFLKGLLIGFSIAAPVGPIGVLCIRRTIASGKLSGLVSGLGAATADSIYGLIAAFGLTLISNFLVSQQAILKLVGGLFLIYLGYSTLRSSPAHATDAVGRNGLLGDYLSTVALTITNPMTILSFVAIFAGLGLASSNASYSSAATLVVGVFTGSALWWLLLSGSVSLLREKIDGRGLRWVNIVSGLTILGFGLVAVGSLVRGILV
jgi:threonine/homoserine/homoserine lactone efflux protein